MVVSLVGGAAIVLFDSRHWKMSERRHLGVLASSLVVGAIGSLVPAYFAGGWIAARVARHPASAKSILGALAGGFLGVALFKRLSGIREPTSDAFARAIPLVMAIGRLGCWGAHCCFGREVPRWLGVDLGDGVPRIPVQLVEAAALFALFLWVDALHRRNRFPDRRLFLVFALYGAIRFATEPLREPIAGALLGLTAYQWFALALTGIGAWQVWRRRLPAAA